MEQKQYKELVKLFNKLIEQTPKSLESKEIVNPIIEITTNILKQGCPNKCMFCPHETVALSYKGENQQLSLDDFIKVLDKIPKHLGIVFSGFSEPFVNKQCTDMVLYANSQGRKISLYTTGYGMTIEDVDRIKNIPFDSGANRGFMLHIPDNESFFKFPKIKGYLEVLRYLKDMSSEIMNFWAITMGAPHNNIKHLFPEANTCYLFNRAGNLEKEVLLRKELMLHKNKYTSVYNKEGEYSCNRTEGFDKMVLLPNGDVTTCCQDYSLENIVGNLFTQYYEDIIPAPGSTFNLCRFCEHGILKEQK